MPTFEGYADVDVEVDEFVSSCSRREIKDLIDVLIEEGHLTNIQPPTPVDERTMMEQEWIDLCEKLSHVRLQLSYEDENVIRDILKKY